MKPKKLSAETKQTLKDLDHIPDKLLKIFLKVLVLCRESGIDPRNRGL